MTTSNRPEAGLEEQQASDFESRPKSRKAPANAPRKRGEELDERHECEEGRACGASGSTNVVNPHPHVAASADRSFELGVCNQHHGPAVWDASTVR
jgi:hypothetical protein